MSVIISGSTSVSGSTDVDYRLNTDGLQFFLDMVNPRSYPGYGERIYDLSPKTKDTSLDLTTYTGGSNPYFTTGNTYINQNIGFNSSNLTTNTLTGSFEIVIKFPPRNSSSYLNMIFGYYDYYFGILQQVNTLAYGTGNGDYWGFGINDSFYDQWHYITCVMYNLRVGNVTTRTNRVLSNQIWIDGIQQPVTQQGANPPAFTGFDFGLGRIGTIYNYYNNNNTDYSGVFDCALFRAYDRALTPEEISRNYRHLKLIYNLS